MVQAMKDTPQEVAGQWANIIATLCGGEGKEALKEVIGAAASGTVTSKRIPDELPEWAQGSLDKRTAL